MPKRILEGLVVSDKGDKTIIVKVERTILHPVMKKIGRTSQRFSLDFGAHSTMRARSPDLYVLASSWAW